MNNTKERFSLLLLEPGEIPFNSYICVCDHPFFENVECSENKGSLKTCSFSIVFQPYNFKYPLFKIPFRSIREMKECHGSTKAKQIIFISCDTIIIIREQTKIKPFRYVKVNGISFEFLYSDLYSCLSLMNQLHRASRLSSPLEQQSMIEAITFSYQRRLQICQKDFDSLLEKFVCECFVFKISPLVALPGKLVLTNSGLYFKSFVTDNEGVFKLKLSAISSIFKRRYKLKPIAMEIFYLDTFKVSHIYLSFENERDRNFFWSSINEQESLKLDDLEQENMTHKWQNGIISNFDYLLFLNHQSDRSFNDLTQYPVMPWVISDYQSDTLDLENPKTFRDLSKPVGALNPERLKRLLERSSYLPNPKYIYGSHYSNPAFVIYFVMRVHPDYMLCLYNGRFDHPDRMFYSVAVTWRNCLSNDSDVKELIPQFYDSDGLIFVNKLKCDFGFRSDGSEVNDVELPKWAQDPQDFIKKCREALESDWVSQNIHHWIDLIFGYKQRGEQAASANNLFHYLAYEGNVDLHSIDDPEQRRAYEVQILEFGQVPKQIFKRPHPRRLPLSQLRLRCLNPTSSKKKLSTISLSQSSVTAMVISKCRRFMIVCYENGRCIWFDTNTNSVLQSVSISEYSISATDSDERYAIFGQVNGKIHVCDVHTGEVLYEWRAHNDVVSGIIASNILITCSFDCSVKIWNLKLDQTYSKISCFYEILQESPITCIEFNKFIFIGCMNEIVCLCDKEKRGEFYVMNSVCVEEKINNIHVLFDCYGQRLICLSNYSKIKIFDFPSWCLIACKDFTVHISTFLFKLDLYVFGYDGFFEVVRWDDCETVFKQSLGSKNASVATSDDNNMYIGTTDGSLIIIGL